MLTEIVNHLWQSTLAVTAVAALAALLRDHGAHVRYWLWWAASVKFLVPFSLLTLLGGSLAGSVVPVIEAGDWPATLGRIAEPMPEAAAWNPLALALLGVWAVGFAAVGGRWFVRALALRKLLRASAQYTAALPRSVGRLEVRTTPTLAEPALVGIFRPVLLLPQGLTEHLSAAQIDAVLAHELSHWRRRDNLTAAVHMLVEAVFWFHPFVWWVGARLVEERERACDEAVVRDGHDGHTYAEGILKVCEHYVASTLKCAAGVSGADLKQRVLEIARSRVMSELPIQKRILLGTFALATVLVPFVFGAVTTSAVAQNDRDVMPLVRINPDYPTAALAEKREGQVILEFTIAAAGTVRDIVVVESTAREFEEPAIGALLKWRYLPTNLTCVGTVCTPIENAVAVERPGVRTVIRFQLNPQSPPPDGPELSPNR
jgi:TonB family protein